ncbi:MAG: SDR family NAD(P)-dependent oxidoreductase, partial [Pirellulaceae bacterium]
VRRRTGDRIDVLINNVGTGILGACEESSTEQVRQLFDINLFGAIRMTNGVLPLMRERREGRLLFLSSAGGIVSLPFAGYYCATKHALEAYVEALRLEIEGQGLSASLIAPGTVRTLAGDKAITPDRPREPYASARERVRAEYVEAIHRGMDPDKVAETILHVLRSARTQPRYVVGWQSWGASWAKAVFSPSWVETGVRYLARTATRH